MITVAFTLMVGVIASHYTPINLVVVDQVVDHPLLWGFVAFTVGSLGVGRFVPYRWARVLFFGTATFVIVPGWLAIWIVLWMPVDAEVVPAPDNRAYELVATEVGVSEAEWALVIRQTEGVLDVEYKVACDLGRLYGQFIDEEGPLAPERSASAGFEPWSADGSRLVAKDFDGNVVAIPVDMKTGRPGPCPN